VRVNIASIVRWISRWQEAYLTFVEHILGDLGLQRLGRLFLLQDLILSQRKKTLEDILTERKAQDQLLPRKARSIEEYGKALYRRKSQ
jgi:hypothetical protein